MSVNTNLNNPESEISLIDILNFLAESRKKLAIAGLVGAVLNLGALVLFLNYTAQYTPLNNTNTNTYALDLVSWKTLQKSLPDLVDQVQSEGKAPEGQSSLYKNLANEQWWQKNVIPSHAISKADIKDLADIGKDLDAVSTTILFLTLTADGSTKEQSLDNVIAAARLLSIGGAYLQILNILNGYEGETISSEADIQKRITTTEIEMGYLIQRAKNLEELHKRFPAEA